MSNYSAAVLADSPALYWPLNEASGTAALDLSAAGTNAGTYAGGFALGSPGGATRADTAVLFDGSTGWARRASSPAALNAGYTVEAWFRCDNLGQTEQVVVTNGGAADGLSVVVNGNAATGNLAMLFNGLTWNTQAVTLVQGAWYHVAVAVDASGHPSLYLNGSLCFASANSTTRPPTSFAAGAEDGGGGVGGRFFSGAVGQVALYPAALPAARLAAHYAAADVPASWGYAGPLPAQPVSQRLRPASRAGLLAAHVMTGYAPAVADRAGAYPLTPGGDAGWATGEVGQEVLFGASDTGMLSPPPALSFVGLTAFTVSLLARSDAQTGGAAGLRYLAGQDQPGATAWVLRLDTVSKFVLGGGAGLPNVLYPAPPVGLWVLYTLRLTASSLDLFYGARRVASAPHGAATVAGAAGYQVGNWNGAVLGSGHRPWRGALAAHYAWGRPLSDAEIAALSADPFAPVRPAPTRLGVLAPPSPTFGTVPWLRGVTAAPRAARVPPPPASGWGPGMAPVVDFLPWLGRPPPPAPPVPPPPALLAPWTPASAPARDPLAWLLRSSPAPAPGVRPPAAPQAGWRPAFTGGPAPPVRHALVRFWRGPEAHMPRLEDGEPAWATDTRSLWVGSATGNVRIGP